MKHQLPINSPRLRYVVKLRNFNIDIHDEQRAGKGSEGKLDVELDSPERRRFIIVLFSKLALSAF